MRISHFLRQTNDYIPFFATIVLRKATRFDRSNRPRSDGSLLALPAWPIWGRKEIRRNRPKNLAQEEKEENKENEERKIGLNNLAHPANNKIKVFLFKKHKIDFR